MNINTIIQALREKAPIFAGRVAGAAELQAALKESAGFLCPAAWVVPLNDDVEYQSKNTARFTITDHFGIYVMADASADHRGQNARNEIETLRVAIWAAILGWEPEENYAPILYEGGEIVQLDRARLFYRFEFSVEHDENAVGSRHGIDLAALPEMQSVGLRVDMIDPAADPNTPPVIDPVQGGYPGGAPGPDGRIEHTISIPTL